MFPISRSPTPAKLTKHAAMTRTGRNQGRYLGETVDIQEILPATLDTARRRGFTAENFAPSGPELWAYHRPPKVTRDWSPRIYLSAGIHGDEPAGPLAVLDLLEQDCLPADAWIWLLPCLNPTGFPRNSREAASGIDLNRDYRHPRSPEIQAHVAWMQRQPMFDLTLCLHEDWEASGFYVYELNPDHHASLAEAMVRGARAVCPIDDASTIDGREAHGGIIRPGLDPATRPEWPEAFYLLQNKTRLSYTLEAPSDFELPTRRAALVAAIREALGEFCSGHCGHEPVDRTDPPR